MKAKDLVGKIIMRTRPVFLSEHLIDVDHMLPVLCDKYSANGIVITNQEGRRELLTREYDDDNWVEVTQDQYMANLDLIYNYTHDRYEVLSEVIERLESQINNGSLVESDPIPVKNGRKGQRQPYTISYSPVTDVARKIDDYIAKVVDSQYIILSMYGPHRMVIVVDLGMDNHGKYMKLSIDRDNVDSYDPDIMVIGCNVFHDKLLDLYNYGVRDVRSFKQMSVMVSNLAKRGLESLADIPDGEKAVVHAGQYMYLAAADGDEIVIGKNVSGDNVNDTVIVLSKDEYMLLNNAIGNEEHIVLKRKI